MSPLRAIREALRRLAVQRALARGGRLGGLGLLGRGRDAVIRRLPDTKKRAPARGRHS